MNEIRARYIQDERDDARKEGKKEGKMEERKEVIINMLNETNDVDHIHKLTKYPRSEIIEIAEML